jgi:hypothetical protein
VWADGGYANTVDDSLLAWAKEKLGVLLEIVKRSDDVKGFQVLPRRWVVERTFGWLVRNRRPARDYEPLTTNSEAVIKLAMIRLMAIRWPVRPCAGPTPSNAKQPADSPWRPNSQRNHPHTQQSLRRLGGRDVGGEIW